MIYNNIERVLVITKWILNYYNTGFSLEITPKVQKVSQKYAFIHKLTTKRNFKTPSLFCSSTETDRWAVQKHAVLKTKSRYMSARADYDYECNLQQKKKKFISASCIHADNQIFIFSFFLWKNF